MTNQEQESKKNNEEEKETKIKFLWGRDSEEAKKPLKTRALNWIIDNALLLALIIIVILAQIDGRFIHNTVTTVELCNQVPTGALIDGVRQNLSDVITLTYK